MNRLTAIIGNPDLVDYMAKRYAGTTKEEPPCTCPRHRHIPGSKYGADWRFCVRCRHLRDLRERE